MGYKVELPKDQASPTSSSQRLPSWTATRPESTLFAIMERTHPRHLSSHPRGSTTAADSAPLRMSSRGLRPKGSGCTRVYSL